mgnify:CR=1 FL=1|tara:strand:- start:568 stop:921 length:354 start_codon:yes stop_codon:yes gene_type:complete
MEFTNYRELVMYYQTTIRNVFLSTAVSFAALGYSRFYRGKSKLYTNSLVLISLLILICSSALNYNLYDSLNEYKKDRKYSEINRWIIINNIFFFIHLTLLILAFYTLYRVYFDKQFN